MEAVIAKRLLQFILEKDVKVAVILVGYSSKEYRFYASSKGVDSKIMLEQMKSSFAAKRGGNQEMIQGSISISKGQMCDFLQKYLNE